MLKLPSTTRKLAGDRIKNHLLILRHAWYGKSTLTHIQNSRIEPQWYSMWAKSLHPDRWLAQAQPFVPPTRFRNCADEVGAQKTDDNLAKGGVGDTSGVGSGVLIAFRRAPQILARHQMVNSSDKGES